jgi:hypothetical protein
MTTPKQGDYVRAVCGESTVVGLIADRAARGWWLAGPTPDSGGWHVPSEAIFTVLDEPELPVGTVVLDVDGEAWQSRENGWFLVATGVALCLGDFDTLNDVHGPLTLLTVA